MDDNIQYIKGVGPRKASLLTKLGVFTIGHLLEYYPRRHEDRSHLKTINNLIDGQLETFKGKIVKCFESKPRRGLHITKITVSDFTGMVQLVWFNQPHIKKTYKPGFDLLITGKVKKTYQMEVQNPEIEIITDVDKLEFGAIVPVYATNESISQRFLRNIIRHILNNYDAISEILPLTIIERFSLLDRKLALENIHFPQSMAMLKQARRRLVFEELYLLQCGLLYIKKQNRSNTVGLKHEADGRLVKQGIEQLPFTLTDDQQKVLSEITLDMEDVKPMQRLLQGDVGSGKTVIAALALVKTVENGYQGAMMVPTEILAEQHYSTLSNMLLPLGIKVRLLTGKLPRRAREQALEEIKCGLVDVVIGTHALLVMTATPIPRTMALTVYGDLDVSTIKQLPPGRKLIKTYVRGSDRRQLVYEFIEKEVKNGRQAYVVCPLVEESEKINAQSAVELYDELLQTELENISCGLVHGKMKSADKELVMDGFYRGEIKVLVATTVIEVGVNVPNATVMIIENAERFGLAQLHQLRGRIGRGGHQSYCILLSDNKNPETQERLTIMTKTNDGFVLAEEDLKIRGPGQFFGTKQHGLPDLKIADIINDIDVFFEARQAAEETLATPEKFDNLRPALRVRFGQEFGMIFCS